MPNIFRVTTVGLMYGQEIQNVLHFHGPSSDPAELSALADHVATNWIGVVKLQQTASLVYTGVRVRMLESQFPTFTKTVNIPGSFGADDQVSTMLAFVLRLRSAVIGKHGRGRLYIGGVLKGWTTNGLVTQAQLDVWATRISTLMGIYGPNGSSNYRLTICPHKAPFNINDVTSMQIASKLGVQRRRNIGIGV